MPAAPPRPVVIFDFDGTLADTWRDIAAALNETLRGEGLREVEGPEVRFWIGDGARKLLERAVPGPQRTEDRIEALYARFGESYAARCLDTTETYPGVTECLHALEGAALAVASNKPTRFLDRVIDGLGLKGHFEVVVGGDTLRARKPDPAVVTHVIERLDAEPTSLWVVGDSAVDVDLGRAAGARTIGCSWGLRGREELRRAGVDHLIESPREIPPLVFRG